VLKEENAMRGKVVALVLAVLVSCAAETARGQTPQLLALDHVALHVADLDKSAKWYEARFGFQVLHRWNGVYMIGKDNIKIGLFLTDKLAPVDDPDHKKIIEHFAFSVDGDKFQATIDKLRADGINVSAVEDTGIAFSVFLRDPDDYQLEITSYHHNLAAPPK
jgi:catechol-2,3-dioxygenase